MMRCFIICTLHQILLPVPVAAQSKARMRGFESRSRHGCMSAFFCVVLSYVGRSFAIVRSSNSPTKMAEMSHSFIS
jgi:hypothetical protein